MIGFIDSGIGGLSILNACADILKGRRIFYLCDNKNVPYGSKSKQRIVRIMFKNVRQLKRMGVHTIVVACNTATACAISTLRAKMPHINFIGTEPNVAGAVQAGHKKIAVLCTPATASYSTIINKFSQDNKIDVICPPNLAFKIETAQDFETFPLLLANVDCAAYDAVVIGCTHYSFVHDRLQELFVNAKIYDSREGVAKRLKDILNQPVVVCTSKKGEKQKQQQIKELMKI